MRAPLGRRPLVVGGRPREWPDDIATVGALAKETLVLVQIQLVARDQQDPLSLVDRGEAPERFAASEIHVWKI
eukprot:7688127-Alexandrium_andersonii.AAC.1